MALERKISFLLGGLVLLAGLGAAVADAQLQHPYGLGAFEGTEINRGPFFVVTDVLRTAGHLILEKLW